MGGIGAFLSGRSGRLVTLLTIWLVAAAVCAFRVKVWEGLHALDTDDVMRLQQVRDLMAGQAWFDLAQHRGPPPTGFDMHWSRWPDVPVAALIGLFDTFLSRSAAETAAMAVWPLILLAVAIALAGVIAERLAGRAAVTPAMIAFAMAGPLFQFIPGRVDHHGLQLTGVMTAVAAVLNLGRRPWAGPTAAIAIAFTLSVGLEGLPFLGLICAFAGLKLLIDGEIARQPVARFGLTLAAATPMFVLAANPWSHVASRACDQAASPILAAAGVGGIGLALVALATPRLRNAASRLAALSMVGLAVLAGFLIAGPNCWRGAYADLDPRLIDSFLRHVQEAQGMIDLLRQPLDIAWSAVFITALMLAAIAVLWRARPQRRLAVGLVSLLALGALLLALHQMRGITYLMAFAAPLMGAGLVSAGSAARISRKSWGAFVLAGLLVVELAVLAGIGAVRLAPKPEATSAGRPAAPMLAACDDPASYRGLSELPPGLAAAAVDSGPFILVASPLSVLSAPYHRNPEGILAANAILQAKPAASEMLVRRWGVRYVVLCRAAVSLDVLAEEAPQGLAAQLVAGRTPDWLTPVRDTPIQVFEVR